MKGPVPTISLNPGHVRGKSVQLKLNIVFAQTHRRGLVKSILVTLHFVLTTFKLFTYAQVHRWIRGGVSDIKGDGNNNNNSCSRERSVSESDGGAVFARMRQKSDGKMGAPMSCQLSPYSAHTKPRFGTCTSLFCPYSQSFNYKLLLNVLYPLFSSGHTGVLLRPGDPHETHLVRADQLLVQEKV